MMIFSIIVGITLKLLNHNLVKWHLMNNIWLLPSNKTLTVSHRFHKDIISLGWLVWKFWKIFLDILRRKVNSVNPFHINEIFLCLLHDLIWYLTWNSSLKRKRFGRLRICIILQNWVWNIIEGLMIFIHLVLVKIIKLNFLEHKNSKILILLRIRDR